jgi:hypothetical protein
MQQGQICGWLPMLYFITQVCLAAVSNPKHNKLIYLLENALKIFLLTLLPGGTGSILKRPFLQKFRISFITLYKIPSPNKMGRIFYSKICFMIKTIISFAVGESSRILPAL